jgi:hypothetical protein
MAIVRSNNLHNLAVPALLEDPRPQGDQIFMFGEGFSKNNLEFQIDAVFNSSTTNLSPTAFAGSSGWPATTARSDDAHLFLDTDMVVHVNNSSTALNVAAVNLETRHITSMNPAIRCKNVYFINDPESNANSIWYSFRDYQNASVTTTYQIRRNVFTRLSDSPPITVAALTGCIVPCFYNPVTRNLVAISNTTGNWGASMTTSRINNMIATTAIPAIVNSGVVANVIIQFLGVDDVGRGIFLRNDFSTDYTQTFIRYDDFLNTQTALSTFSAIPAAAGTSAGGNRATGFGNRAPLFSSTTFPSIASGFDRSWYTPYFDSVGRYHPFLFHWNTNTNTFSRINAITVNWGDGNTQDTFWQTQVGAATGAATVHAHQRFWYNETFTVVNDENESQRFLTLIQVHGNGVFSDTSLLQRNFVTFLVDPEDNTVLTYHSSLFLPTTPKNIIWLNEEHTVMGVFLANNFMVFKFDIIDGSGWTLTANLPYIFNSVGRDSLGRIWATDNMLHPFGRLHILTPSIPASVLVNFDQPSYKYQGTDINTTVNVSAFDLQGNRISATVTLTIQGTSLKFINDDEEEVSELVVETLPSGDLEINAVIKSAGTSNIISSVDI